MQKVYIKDDYITKIKFNFERLRCYTMEKTTVTARARFDEIIDLAQLAAENGFEGFDFEGMVAFARKEIAKLDKKAAKAKETAAAKKSASDELTEAIFGVLTDELASIADIAAKVEGDEVTPAKCQYRLNKLVESGRAVKDELILETEGGKKRKVVGFALAPVDAE